MAGRRAFVAFARSRGEIPTSRACEVAKVSRRRLSYVSRKGDGELAAALKDLTAANPRYGVRMLCVMLSRQRRVVIPKWVRRLCREHGLMLRQKRKRKWRGIGRRVPCRAEPPDHV